ncbi:hypothetical protein [Streptomyces sp. NRRL S-241]|uniref:hypothetical protein n=1 Tax=Streptomyces sp. NRRL S-241 TaxID=1463896 RepID=UPI0004C08E44|nr:hypothetical protein [Streptomyces sp. NRRL S-241]
MDWLIAAAQQPSTSASPVWLAPLLGGVGAAVGGSLTSFVSWRVLSDTKKARQRADEKEAAEIITAALLQVRQIYRKSAVGSPPVPEDEFEHWTDYLLAKLGASEAAVMRFHDKALRERLTASLDLLIWGAHDNQLLHETRSHVRAVAYEAHRDAMECLGAHMRREQLPKATKAWMDASGQLEWQMEQVRRAEEGE